MISRKLLAALLTGTVVSPIACSKKKSNSSTGAATEVTDAGEDTRFSSAVANGALAITGLDIIGASATESAGLRLTANDYEADSQRLNVYDPAMDALSQAGNIICFFNQAAYVDMIGKGPYVAQADMDTCFKDKGNSDSGQSSGSTKKLTTLYVDSNRADEYSPLIAKVWFTMEQEDNGSVMKVDMQVKMVVAEGQSDANPVGIFKLSWEGKVDGQAMMKGFIETKRSAEEGKIILNLVDSSSHGQGQSETTAGSAELSYDTILKEVTGGVVHTSTPVWDNNTPSNQEFGAAFNDGFFLRKNISKNNTACLAKDEYDYSVWRYGLYNAVDGSRVQRNSGFPITVSSNGSVAYGWAGYWGLWLPPSVTIADGLTVTKSEHGEAATSYSVKVGPGKLLKKTRQSIALSDLKDVELSANMAIIAYDGTSFKKIGNQGNNGQVDYITPVPFTLSSMGGGAGHAGSANVYSQALGGQVILPYDASGNPLATAFYYKEENVTATAGNLSLNCFQQCLQPQINSQQASGSPWDQNASNATSPYFTVNWQTYFQSPNINTLKKAYTYDAATMTLKYSGSSVTLADGVSLSGNNSWGLQSGPMVTDAVAATITNPFDTYGVSEYYTWETGSNTWNKFIAIRDSNNAPVTFDAPLFLAYTHSAANDRSGLATGTGAKFYDKKLLLQYQGYGQLQGIPSASDENNHYAPLFAIKDGTLAGDSGQYKIKALDVEVRMREKVAASCAALSLGSLPALPTISSYKAPELGTQPSGLEGEAPAVVEGVVQ